MDRLFTLIGYLLCTKSFEEAKNAVIFISYLKFE